MDNILVAGGSVLGCLRGLSDEIDSPTDIDIFLYNLTDEEIAVRMRVLLAQLKISINKVLTADRRSRRVARLTEGLEDVKETQQCYMIKTPNALTITPTLAVDNGRTKAYPAVQIITRKYPTKRSIFNSFDVDCCCVGFDGERVWAHPRAHRAITTGVNTVNLAYKNPRSYEYRLLKYARRGFAIHDPAWDDRPTLLSSYLQTADRLASEGGADLGKVPVEWLVRCIRRTSGLLQILLAEEAEKRGVVWAKGFDSIISFDGEIDEQLDELGGEVLDEDGNLLVFAPLKDPNRHETSYGCGLEELLTRIAEPQEEESIFLRFTSGIVPARDANRKAWEKGLYETEEEDFDALPAHVVPRQNPSTSRPVPSNVGQGFSAKPAASGLSSTASSSSPTAKRRNTGGAGARVAALQPPSPLMDLPRVLLLEILRRCTGPSTAALAAACKTLNGIVARPSTWRALVERDFGDTTERPRGCRQPEPWNVLYGALDTLRSMKWRQFDEHPLRLQCVPGRRGYHPFPREGHAVSYMEGNKLVMTGGRCPVRPLEIGTIVFDLATSNWSVQPTCIRSAPQLRGGSNPSRNPPPYVLPSRTHHTSTAVNQFELLLLFGKQRAADADSEPTLASEILSLDFRNWTYIRVNQEGIHPPLRRSHSACLHPDGNALLVLGGSGSAHVDLSTERERPDDPADRERVFTPAELEVFDDLHVLTRTGEHTWAWSQPVTSGKAPMARCGHSALMVGRTMVVVGGRSNLLTLPNEVFLLDVDTMRWRTLFMPTCFPPKDVTFPNTAVAIRRKLLLTRGGSEALLIDLDKRAFTKIDSGWASPGEKKLGSRVPEDRTGHTLTRVGVSLYMVGGRLGLATEAELEREPIETLAILDLIGKRVV